MDHVLVHTGQNYDHELNQAFFDDLSIRQPDHYLDSAASGAEGTSTAQTIGNIIAESDRVIGLEKPDALLVLGDTNSCLCAISAKRRKVPVFHMEAGNRCFDERVPEEINRRIVDHTSDVNMPYSDISREYLLREGLPPDRVVKTGSPMYEILHHYMPKVQASDVLARLCLQPGAYFVVSCHREENVDDDVQLGALYETLEAVTRRYGLPVIFSAHPRTRKRLDRSGGFALPPLVRVEKPLCLTDYLALQLGAKAVLSDSGTITEESSILNFPALNIRNAHERPEGMEESSVMLTGLAPATVLQGLAILATQGRGPERTLRAVADYSCPNVSEKVVRIILSYTGYVNRVVWRSGG
jgi:UDP-N-acetyl-L-fucosamine synthase